MKNSLSDETLNDTLEQFETKKKLALELNLPDFYNAIENFKKAMCSAECGHFLTFDKYRNKISDELARILAWASFCKIRWCPMCAWRKARKLIAEILSILSQIERDYRVGYIFLTLTTKNAPLSDLRALSAHMSVSWRRFIQTKSFKKAVLGYIRAIEYLGDETPVGECHLHYHSVLVVPLSYFGTRSYITQAQWVEMWAKALRSDYKPIVHIRGIRPKPSTKLQPTSHRMHKNAIFQSQLSPALYSALCECVKYIAKSAKIAQLDSEQFATLDSQAKGLRQFNRGGLLKDKRYPAQELEPLDPELWDFLEREFYKWSGQNYESCTPMS
ncbi:protein rep [Helicobacter felis]|uniref:protein rep n=1 Tax=Helicobacter felis TaxID=214 RepID=UPI000CF111F1|nr:protein rep [Helicobacter felis]